MDIHEVGIRVTLHDNVKVFKRLEHCDCEHECDSMVETFDRPWPSDKMDILSLHSNEKTWSRLIN
jgi:hypothetical protein